MARELADWLNAFMQYTEETEPPRLYREWAGISCIASALERKCSSGWMRYKLYPNFYIALVGPSGIGKSQALETVESFLVKLGVPLSPTTGSRQGITMALREANQSSITPSGEHLTHSSLTIHCSELVNFLGYHDDDFIMTLTNWYDCGGVDGKWSNRTVSRGMEEIHGVWVNLIGGAVPEALREHLPTTAFLEGGFAGRVVFVYADKPGKLIPIPNLGEAEIALGEQLLNDLEKIHILHGEFKVTAEWMDHWADWYFETYGPNPPFTHPTMRPYLFRRRVHLAKLCMVLSASEGDDMVLTKKILERGIEMLKRVEVPMPRTFYGFGTSQNARIMAQMMEFIARERSTTERKIYNRYEGAFDGWKHFRELLDALRQRHFCKLVYSENGQECKVIYRTDHEHHDMFKGLGNETD